VSDRDRDTAGRARNARARDELGRPLPTGRSGVARAPEGIIRTAAETIAQARMFFVAGRPFHAHEVFEDAWKQTGGPDREVWRALAQLAVGLTHRMRGNEAGAHALLVRAADSLEPYAGTTPFGLPVDAIRADIGELIADASRSRPASF
jgi:hypothetical protein